MYTEPMGMKPRRTPLEIAKERIKELEQELEQARRDRRVPKPPGGGFALEHQQQVFYW